MEKMIISPHKPKPLLKKKKKKRGNLVEFNKLHKRVALCVATWTAALKANRFMLWKWSGTGDELDGQTKIGELSL